MIKQLNKKQEAKFNSFRPTEQYINENIEIINTIPVFLANYGRIKARITDILLCAQTKSVSLTDIATSKLNSRKMISNKNVAIAEFVYTFAADNNDEPLKQKINSTPTRLKRTRDDELALRRQFVHECAKSNLAALADYNITAAKFNDLQMTINNFKLNAPNKVPLSAPTKPPTPIKAVGFQDFEQNEIKMGTNNSFNIELCSYISDFTYKINVA